MFKCVKMGKIGIKVVYVHITALQVDVTEFHVQHNIHFRKLETLNLREIHMC